jgi:hypothetical protein
VFKVVAMKDKFSFNVACTSISVKTPNPCALSAAAASATVTQKLHCRRVAKTMWMRVINGVNTNPSIGVCVIASLQFVLMVLAA